jgi:hypothetical protein
VYLDFNRYTEMGGTLGSAAYPMYYHRAQSVIDAITHGRVRGETPARPAVQYAVYALVEALSAAGADGNDVQSYSNDGVSVTYAVKDMHTRLVDIATEYLRYETTASGVSLLYAGVDA